MKLSWLKTFVLILMLPFCFVNESSAQQEKEYLDLALRMIGHQVLLNFGDSTSLVLPIEHEDGKFRIRFQSKFQFLPSELAGSIDSIIRVTNFAESYRIEVENDETKQITYSYEVNSAKNSIVPCGPRAQPKAKYSLLVTVLDSSELSTATINKSGGKSTLNFLWIGSIIVGVILLILAIFFWKLKNQRSEKTELIQIGKYRFDERNMKLLIKKETIDLTSKEADLIALLLSSVNVTLERDVILKAVWEDDGDYVGRTLDVFISKLRKKFAEDSTVKIVNVRGVGYKLMLDASS